jgi:uncharacterized protein (TIGR03067 family)
MRHWFCPAILTLVVAVTAQGAGDPKAQSELSKFDGSWQLVSAVTDGKPTPDDFVAKVRITIRNGKHTVKIGDEIAVKEIPFTVDPTTVPKSTIDTLPDGQTIKGIYQLQGDTLTSCVARPGADRPTVFASEPGSGHTLRVFKRVKD